MKTNIGVHMYQPSKYVQSKKALVNQKIDGYQVTAHKIINDRLWWYRMAILKDGREVWADSVSYEDRKGERSYWSASSCGDYTSAKRLVLDVATKVIRNFNTGE